MLNTPLCIVCDFFADFFVNPTFNVRISYLLRSGITNHFWWQKYNDSEHSALQPEKNTKMNSKE